MSEESTEENQPAELAFQPNGIKLTNNTWTSYLRNPNEVAAFLNLKKEIQDKLAAGEPVYVQIRDHRRKGSIGRLKSAEFEYQPASIQYSYRRDTEYGFVKNLEVIWDGRKNKCSPYPGEVEYLPNWSGGTVWNWTKGESKEKDPVVVPYDHLGQEIEPGQFVCFVHRRYGRISMKFGTVTRLTPKGGVFVKSLKLRDNDPKSEELRAYDSDELIIVNDKLMSRLMMARLAAD